MDFASVFVQRRPFLLLLHSFGFLFPLEVPVRCCLIHQDRVMAVQHLQGCLQQTKLLLEWLWRRPQGRLPPTGTEVYSLFIPHQLEQCKNALFLPPRVTPAKDKLTEGSSLHPAHRARFTAKQKSPLLKSVFAINLVCADQWRQLLNHSSGRKQYYLGWCSFVSIFLAIFPTVDIVLRKAGHLNARNQNTIHRTQTKTNLSASLCHKRALILEWH